MTKADLTEIANDAKRTADKAENYAWACREMVEGRRDTMEHRRWGAATRWFPCLEDWSPTPLQQYRPKPAPRIVQWTLATLPVGPAWVGLKGRARARLIVGFSDAKVCVSGVWMLFDDLLRLYDHRDVNGNIIGPCGTEGGGES